MNKNESVTSISLKKWNEGETQGLNTLIERHMPWIRNHVRKRVGPFLRSRGETCDYVQDVVVEFLRYGPRIQISNDDHFRALLARIAENAIRGRCVWFNALRRKIAKEKPLPSDTVLYLDPPQNKVERPSQAADQHEKEAWIRLGLELIDPEDQEVIVLRQWEELPFSEISKKLGLTEDAAWARHKRAIHRLSKMVGQLRRNKMNAVMDDVLFK